jgi:PTS system nitrogen regulatory IIA component
MEEAMRITDLSADDVVLDLGVESKRDLLRTLSAEAASRLGRPEQEVLDPLEARERLGSTAVGRGVALPHARISGNNPPIILFARLRRPIDFEAKDDEPIDLVFLVLWPDAFPEGLLPALSEICQMLREPETLRRLRAVKSPESVVTLLRQGKSSAPRMNAAPEAG